MMPIARKINYTYTYSILEISQSAFDDIKQRLIELEYWEEFRAIDDGREIIVLGTVALKAE